MLKQKTKAGETKIKRYEERCLQYKQSNLFRSQLKLFHEILDKGNQDETDEISTWGNIWRKGVYKVNKAICSEPNRSFSIKLWTKVTRMRLSLPNLTTVITIRGNIWSEMERDPKTTEVQDDIHIKSKDTWTEVRIISNWNVAGLDHVQGFWSQKMTELHPRL